MIGARGTAPKRINALAALRLVELCGFAWQRRERRLGGFKGRGPLSLRWHLSISGHKNKNLTIPTSPHLRTSFSLSFLKST